MSRENVVISLDGHTECFLNLKPWIPQRFHTAVDDAVEEGRRNFFGGSRYFAERMFAGTEFAWQATNDLQDIDL